MTTKKHTSHDTDGVFNLPRTAIKTGDIEQSAADPTNSLLTSAPEVQYRPERDPALDTALAMCVSIEELMVAANKWADEHT